LTLFSNSNGEIYNYAYNADGIRTQKNVFNANGDFAGSTEYIYDGTKLIAESRNGDWLYYFYDANGTVTGMYYNNVLYYFRKNLQGDVTGIYNASGNIIAQYEYTPYGAPLTITNGSGTDVSTNATHIANINPFRYRGYYYDTETGFYYLITRYYDPVVGRFLNADAFASTGQGILGNNMFAYCLNNPVNSHDPTGMCTLCYEGKVGPCSDGHFTNGCPCTSEHIKRVLQGRERCSIDYNSADYIYAKQIENSIIILAQNYVVSTYFDITKGIISAYYIPPSLTQTYYIEWSKHIHGSVLSDEAETVALIAGMILSHFVPLLGIALDIADGISMLATNDLENQLDEYEKAMKQGGGVLVINWLTIGPRNSFATHTDSYSCENLKEAVNCLLKETS